MRKFHYKKAAGILSAVLISALAAGLVSGCGPSMSRETSETYAAANYMAMDSGAGFTMASEAKSAAYDSYAEPSVYEAAEMEASGGSNAVTGAELENAAEARSSRKLIRNVNVDIQTETMDTLLQDIQKKVAEYQGYVENSSIYGGDYYGNGGRSASYTVRIPADHLDEFLDTALLAGKITSRSENVEDITLRYTDLESRVKSLKVEQERLLELMKDAQDVDAIIALESRLSEIRYELENIQSSLKVYDNQVTYSSVYIYINEVKKIIPGEKESFATRLSTGFRSNLEDLMDSLEDFALWFIISIPNFIVWIVGIAIVLLLLRVFGRLFRRIFKIPLPSINLKRKLRNKKAVKEAGAAEETTEIKKNDDPV